MVCFRQRNLAGVGRLLLDGVAVYLALARSRAKNLNTVSLFHETIQ